MAKITGSRFMVMIAARPGQTLDYMGSNFWFSVMDQEHSDQRALYYLGNIETPPQRPISWSITDPAILTTPKPIGVADWGGRAVFWERNVDRDIRTEIWISPDALDGGPAIRFAIHAHLNSPQPGRATDTFVAPFKLREIAPGVEPPAGTPIYTGPSVLAFAPLRATLSRA
jgi:hypothetical protein